VVDDQPANIQTVGTLLHAEGYDVMSATSAEQALQRLRARRPDLLLLDMMMPGTSGLELCRVLRAKPSLAEVPVIFLSAADEVGLITAALEAGAVDYVTKPFRRAELLGRIRTHIALKAARDELQRLAEEKDELLNLMAHDLKNGLAAIRLHAEFLARHAPELGPPARQCVDTLSHEAVRLAECIGELLASQASGPQPLRLAPVDLVVHVREAVDAHRPLAEAKGQRLDFEVPGAEPCVVLADAAALRQVLDNLVSNAIKFSPPGRRVRVDVMPGGGDDGGPGLRVCDQGPGFTAEDQRLVFRRYGRLSAQPTGGETSTGLGLSIVKKLIDRMGGTIRLESQPGAGASFTVRLPAGDAPADVAGRPASAAP
jgi:two-component system sensor histidine kinase/response regulator